MVDRKDMGNEGQSSNKICYFWLVLWALSTSFDVSASIARQYYKLWIPNCTL